MNAIEHLETVKWEHPDYYSGHSPVGDFLIYSRTRDSSILEDTNYKNILADLLKLAESFEETNTSDTPFVYDFRASHCICGWVEYIIVQKIAPETVLEAAGEIICSLEGYPVYSDDNYSQACYDAINEYWENESLQGRIELCKEANISIFASRRDSLVDEVYDILNDKIF